MNNLNIIFYHVLYDISNIILVKTKTIIYILIKCYVNLLLIKYSRISDNYARNSGISCTIYGNSRSYCSKIISWIIKI